jgi:hypothetical protein
MKKFKRFQSNQKTTKRSEKTKTFINGVRGYNSKRFFFLQMKHDDTFQLLVRFLSAFQVFILFLQRNEKNDYLDFQKIPIFYENIVVLPNCFSFIPKKCQKK